MFDELKELYVYAEKNGLKLSDEEVLPEDVLECIKKCRENKLNGSQVAAIADLKVSIIYFLAGATTQDHE